jgi:DNA (cytosine-5)-methyltransferase 1
MFLKTIYDFGDYLTVGEASKLLGVCAGTLRNWDKAGLLIAYRHEISNYRLYKKEDLIKILKKTAKKG